MATKRVKNPESLDAIDIALASAVDSDAARALLEKQARLIDSQETLARADFRHRGWQIIGERIGALLKAMTVAVGLLALFLIANFLWTAHKASGLVMDPFNVPATMNGQGLTGAVVAQQLLDKVSALEKGTQSARASSSYENSWSDSKGVEVPYAGVSLGELRREARDWLGSEKHLSGDVVQLSGGNVAISFRTPLGSGRVEGPGDNLDGLLGQVAVLLFKTTQPYRFTIWRERNGASTEELRSLFTALARSSDPREVAWGYHGLANGVATSNAERRAYYDKAFAAQPKFLPAFSNLPFYFAAEGRDEEAHHAFAESAKALAAGAEDYTPSHAKHYGLGAQARAAIYEGDLTRAAQLLSESSGYTADAINTAFGPFEAAAAWLAAHDFPTAQAQLAAAGYLDPQRRAEVEKLVGAQPSLALLHAIATNDVAAQAQGWSAYIQLYQSAAKGATDSKARQDALDSIDQVRPDLALALARSGQLSEARAIIAPLPASSDPALRIRAFIAALSRDPAAAGMFEAAAVRTPTLPAAQMLWTEALVRINRPAEALIHVEAAAKFGPNAADNYRWWGRALLDLHRPAQAAEKFGLAAKNAPAWARTRLDWAEALWLAGDRGGAIAQLKEASTRTLNDDDRALLRRMVASAKRQVIIGR